jgi:hypothetical protein
MVQSPTSLNRGRLTHSARVARRWFPLAAGTTVFISLLALAGCESVPVRAVNPNPYVEYQESQQEYNNARAYLAQVQANQRINAMNERLGNFSGSKNNEAMGALLSASADLGDVDAQQKVDAAARRLDAAIHNLPQNGNPNVQQTNRPFQP